MKKLTAIDIIYMKKKNKKKKEEKYDKKSSHVCLHVEEKK